MKMRQLGPWKVSAVGLGCMPLSIKRSQPAPHLSTREQAIAVIHGALDAGITLLDTADIYAPSWRDFGHNEVLVGEALRSWSASPEIKEKVIVATKNGITRGPNESWGRASTKDYFLRAAEASALRLGVAKIDLWQHHRMNPEMDFETQFENVLVLKDRGIVDQIGLSNVNIAQLERALAIGGPAKAGGVVSVQNQYSPRYRLESEVIDFCLDNDMTYLPWSPLGGIAKPDNMANGNFQAFHDLALRYNCSAHAITISWLLHRSPAMLPIPGASKVDQIQDFLREVEIELSAEEITFLDNSLPTDVEPHPEILDQPPFRSA